MRRTLTCSIALTLAATTLSATAAAAPPSPSSAPSSAPPSEVAKPQARPDRAALQRRLDRVVDRGAVGAVAHVVDHGTVWRGAAGVADRTTGQRAVPGARFRAASVTKQVTAVLALQLVERGTWTLDTTIGDVLPDLWPQRADVTVGQLLSHTSGVPDNLLPMIARADTVRKFLRVVSKRRTDRELVAVGQRQPYLFEPGTASGYSNTGFVIVGMMLKAQTGQRLDALARARVLKPAGMTRSRWATGRAMPQPRLKEYGGLGKNGRLVDLGTFQPSMFSAAGALLTTARDLNRFQAALSRGRLLRKPTLATMRSVVTGLAPSGAPYGYGSYRIPDPCRPGGVLHGHDGASWGTNTLSFASPDGRRRVSVSMTGREFTAQQPAFDALNALVVQAFAATCGGGFARSAGAPTLPEHVDRSAVRLP